MFEQPLTFGYSYNYAAAGSSVRANNRVTVTDYKPQKYENVGYSLPIQQIIKAPYIFVNDTLVSNRDLEFNYETRKQQPFLENITNQPPPPPPPHPQLIALLDTITGIIEFDSVVNKQQPEIATQIAKFKNKASDSEFTVAKEKISKLFKDRKYNFNWGDIEP